MPSRAGIERIIAAAEHRAKRVLERARPCDYCGGLVVTGGTYHASCEPGAVAGKICTCPPGCRLGRARQPPRDCDLTCRICG